MNKNLFSGGHSVMVLQAYAFTKYLGTFSPQRDIPISQQGLSLPGTFLAENSNRPIGVYGNSRREIQISTEWHVACTEYSYVRMFKLSSNRGSRCCGKFLTGNFNLQPKMKCRLQRVSGGKFKLADFKRSSLFIGHMILTFSDSGDLTEWSGDPILLDNSVPKVGRIVLYRLLPNAFVVF